MSFEIKKYFSVITKEESKLYDIIKGMCESVTKYVR